MRFVVAIVSLSVGVLSLVVAPAIGEVDGVPSHSVPPQQTDPSVPRGTVDDLSTPLVFEDHPDLIEVIGIQYPYSMEYDAKIWQMLPGDAGNAVEYVFIKGDGSKAKVTAEFHAERIHYTEIPPYLVEELASVGVTNVQIQTFQMIQVNGIYYIYCRVSGDLPDGEQLVGYVFSYLTDAGMLRFAFATVVSEGDAHDVDFENLLKGVKISN